MSNVTASLKLNKYKGNLERLSEADRHASEDANLEAIDTAIAGVTGVEGAALDTDGTLAADSDARVASQKATKTYVGAETTRAEAAEALLAPKASPTFTGTVTVPTSGLAIGTIPDTRVLFPLGGVVSSDSDLTFDIVNDRLSTGKIRATESAPPSSATDTGVTGDIQWDANFIYVCVATNSWKRAAIAAW